MIPAYEGRNIRGSGSSTTAFWWHSAGKYSNIIVAYCLLPFGGLQNDNVITRSHKSTHSLIIIIIIIVHFVTLHSFIQSLIIHSHHLALSRDHTHSTAGPWAASTEWRAPLEQGQDNYIFDGFASRETQAFGVWVKCAVAWLNREAHPMTMLV